MAQLTQLKYDEYYLRFSEFHGFPLRSVIIYRKIQIRSMILLNDPDRKCYNPRMLKK